MDIKEIVSFVGDKTGELSTKIISSLSEMGADVSPIFAKLVFLLINLLLIWLVIKFVNIANKPLKWAIIGILAFLIISTIFSLVS